MTAIAGSTPLDKPVPDWPVIFFLTIVHLGALTALLPIAFSWGAIGVAVFLHWLTGGVGITLGYHRLITHRSFQTPKWFEYLLLFCGILSCQRPLEWVAKHRMHHENTDAPGDPHDSTRGFWWTHIGWILHKLPCDRHIPRYTKDIARDPIYRFFDRSIMLWQVALAGLLFTMGGWPFVVWGIFVRLVSVYHCTWFVNSAAHRWGRRPYQSGDYSTNCWWVALLAYGEGWHNNHHAFPNSARQGLRWWEVDMTWWMVRIFQSVGLVRRIKLPSSIDAAVGLSKSIAKTEIK